ncbi:hypothetical protein M514_09577 [Trichuris suis]|uniref:Uncharacterized protein n=1 Tax=Trichuris suis TaxID=68888 RepID=A0A085LX56_9BILA|nr:hypothetical protein M513_09577 [Trichuris suis]KFD64231.1 hypothetical protein M514_09577 [Trichuris suis]
MAQGTNCFQREAKSRRRVIILNSAYDQKDYKENLQLLRRTVRYLKQIIETPSQWHYSKVCPSMTEASIRNVSYPVVLLMRSKSGSLKIKVKPLKKLVVNFDAADDQDK